MLVRLALKGCSIVNGARAPRLATRHRPLPVEASASPGNKIIPPFRLIGSCRIFGLDRAALKSIAVIGPNAAETLVLAGNYIGTPAAPVSVLDGIRALVSPKTQVNYARGCELIGDNQDGFAEAIQAAPARATSGAPTRPPSRRLHPPAEAARA